MDWLTIFVIVLVAAVIWAVVELALTIRKARGSVDTLVDEVQGTVKDVNAVIKKVDTTVEDVNPAVKQLEPLLSKAETTIDAVTLDLLHLNDTIADINTVTGAGAKATNAVTGVVDKAANAVSGAVSRIAGKADEDVAKLEGSAAPTLEGTVEVAEVKTEAKDSGYFTYPGDEADPDSTKTTDGEDEE